MARIVVRILGFIFIFLAISNMSSNWDAFIRLPVQFTFVGIAIVSTIWSFKLLKRNIIEVSSHLTIVIRIFVPIYGLVFIFKNMNYSMPTLVLHLLAFLILFFILLNRFKFLLIKDDTLIFRGLFRTDSISFDQLEKIKNTAWTLCFIAKVKGRHVKILILPSWFEEMKRLLSGQPTSVDKVIDKFNKIKGI